MLKTVLVYILMEILHLEKILLKTIRIVFRLKKFNNRIIKTFKILTLEQKKKEI